MWCCAYKQVQRSTVASGLVLFSDSFPRTTWDCDFYNPPRAVLAGFNMTDTDAAAHAPKDEQRLIILPVDLNDASANAVSWAARHVLRNGASMSGELFNVRRRGWGVVLRCRRASTMIGLREARADTARAFRRRHRASPARHPGHLPVSRTGDGIRRRGRVHVCP